MNIIKSIKSYWRIYLLVAVTLLSLAIIFNPVVPGLDAGSTGDINNEDATFIEKYSGIQFNIELGGGTRVRAPLIGMTAEDVEIGDRRVRDLEQSISNDINNVSVNDITIRTGLSNAENEENKNTTIELTRKGVTKEEFAQSLEKNNIEYSNIRNGLTEETRNQAVRILQNKIDSAGLSGGDVRKVQVGDGAELILIEVPNANREETIDLINQRGEVRIDIYYKNQTTNEYETLEGVLTRDDMRTVGSPQQSTRGQLPNVPVTIEPTSAQRFQEQAVDKNVASVGGSSCRYEVAPEETQSCLLTVVDGEVVYSAGMAPSLASSMRSGSWAESPNFILQTETFEEAQELSTNLDAGALPANLDLENGETSFISPSQGEEFRFISFIIGLMATLTVALSVSLRYGKAGIAAPMMITALAEVVVLIAIAVILSYPVDIAVIAGFIAVIGTGVDDLIIIADRVIGGENPASSSMIFERRFKSALWIILGAAGTTILAIGPIAVLELQQLQGFAIFTIIGVLVGIILTRPSYGDMLRYLYTER